jgi:hypothetical protein
MTHRSVADSGFPRCPPFAKDWFALHDCSRLLGFERRFVHGPGLLLPGLFLVCLFPFPIDC